MQRSGRFPQLEGADAGASDLRLRDFDGRHAGQSIVICGCGRSLASFRPPPNRYVTIGVNDVGRRFDPTYLLVANPRHCFSEERFRYIARSRASALFTQLDLDLDHDQVVKFSLGKRGSTDVHQGDHLPYTQNSPYMAACLARRMGARRIGLVGVDLTDDHFFGATGRHPLLYQLARIDAEYAKLSEAFAAESCELVNLSSISLLESLPRMSLEEFGYRNAPPSPRRVERAASRTVHEYVQRSVRRTHTRDLPVQGDLVSGRSQIGVRFSLRPRNRAIVDIDYKATGCATLLACCEAIVEQLTDRNLSTAHALTEGRIRRSLRGIHPGHGDRVELALRALRSALQAASQPQAASR